MLPVSNEGILAVFLVTICIKGVLSQISIETAPQNVAVLAGGTAQFQCSIQQSELLPSVLAWEECITEPVTCLRISSDDDIIYQDLGGDPLRQNRYHVNSVGGNQFDLVISDVIMAEDAGKYRCQSLNNAATTADAQLVILESETNCTLRNNSHTDNQVHLAISITCQVAYSGALEPVIEFIKEEVTNGRNITLAGRKDQNTTPGSISYILDYQIQAGDLGSIFYARTYFRDPTGGGDEEADNAPDYEHFVKFDPINYDDSGSPPRACPFSVAIFLTTFAITFL